MTIRMVHVVLAALAYADFLSLSLLNLQFFLFLVSGLVFYLFSLSLASTLYLRVRSQLSTLLDI